VTDAPKRERLRVFLERLRNAPPASTTGEATALVNEMLDGVEDEMTDIPFDPDAAQQLTTDGRMYGPHESFASDWKGRPDLTRYAHARHDTLIGASGAILIRIRRPPRILLSKPGADGLEIDLDEPDKGGE